MKLELLDLEVKEVKLGEVVLASYPLEVVVKGENSKSFREFRDSVKLGDKFDVMIEPTSEAKENEASKKLPRCYPHKYDPNDATCKRCGWRISCATHSGIGVPHTNEELERIRGGIKRS